MSHLHWFNIYQEVKTFFEIIEISAGCLKCFPLKYIKLWCLGDFGSLSKRISSEFEKRWQNLFIESKFVLYDNQMVRKQLWEVCDRSDYKKQQLIWSTIFFDDLWEFTAKWVSGPWMTPNEITYP